MALLNYMQRNRFGVYEYKRRIPKDLLEKLPQYRTGFIKFSLQTKDANEAKRLKQQQDAIHEAMFDEVRGAEDSMNVPKHVVEGKSLSGRGGAKASQPKTGKYLSDLEFLWKQEGGKTSKTFGAMQRLVAKGLSHEALAKKAKVTRPAISHIENSKRKPSLLVCLRIAEGLDTSLAGLISKAESKIRRNG